MEADIECILVIFCALVEIRYVKILMLIFVPNP